MLVFDIDPISFVFNQKLAAIKNFGIFDFVAVLFSIFDIIKIVAEQIQKRIDVIKAVIDIDNSNHDQHKHINTISTDQRQIKRNSKKDKQRKVAQKMLVGDVFLWNNFHLDRFIGGKIDIPDDAKNSKSNQEQERDKI